jgi:quinol monooxygenase YgiN
MTVRKTARFVVNREQTDAAVVAIRVFVAHVETEPGTLLYRSWRRQTARPSSSTS